MVVNNAGILRDKSFAKMSETDWGIYSILIEYLCLVQI